MLLCGLTMKISNSRIRMAVLLLIGTGAFGKQVISRQPAPGADGVCVDTHLTLTFDEPPALGTAGTIQIYDASDDQLVDLLDVGVPTNQQTYVIGGSSLHAYPVILSDKVVTIYPHPHKLAYG